VRWIAWGWREGNCPAASCRLAARVSESGRGPGGLESHWGRELGSLKSHGGDRDVELDGPDSLETGHWEGGSAGAATFSAIP